MFVRVFTNYVRICTRTVPNNFEKNQNRFENKMRTDINGYNLALKFHWLIRLRFIILIDIQRTVRILLFIEYTSMIKF